MWLFSISEFCFYLSSTLPDVVWICTRSIPTLFLNFVLYPFYTGLNAYRGRWVVSLESVDFGFGLV